MTPNANPDCRQVRELLDLYALDGLSAQQRQAVQDHLAVCPDCREAESLCSDAVSRIRLSATSPAPRTALAAAIGAATRDEILNLKVSRRRLRLTWAASLAAMLVLGAAAFLAIHARNAGHGPAQMAVRQLWQLDGQQGAAGAQDEVVVQGQNLYLLRTSAEATRVACFDTGGGTMKWQSQDAAIGPIAADNGRVYCLMPSDTGGVTLTALDAGSGKQLWQFGRAELPDMAQLTSTPEPMPLQGNRVCWTTGNTIQVLDSATGTPIWSQSVANETGLSSAAAVGENLFVADVGALHCLSLRDGRELWRQPYDENAELGILCRPLLAVSDAQVYVAQMSATGRDRLFCFDSQSHRVMWSRPIPQVAHMFATPEALYLRGQTVAAVNADNGEPLWTYKAGGCGPITYSEGLVYFVDSSQAGRLVALNAQTGGEVLQVPGIHSCNAICKVGNRGILRTQDGIVHVLAFGR